MTYEELITFLEARIGFPLCKQQSLSDALAAAQENQLADPLAAEILRGLYQGNHCTSLDSPVDRTGSFEGLAALRLRSQADDADAQLFRKVLHVSQEMDAAFDAEIMRARQ